MRIFMKKILPIAAALAAVVALAGCSKRITDPVGTAKPSLSPRTTETAGPSASPSAAATDTASPGNTAEASHEPGSITGFMEGGVVDPDDVPELVAALAEHEEYRDMSIQSITYKLYEERQAYYVVLQGEGEATHPVYVFADGSIILGM